MENAVIEELITLANDNSAQARRALSERVCNLCLGSSYQLSVAEKQLAGEILIRLLRELEIDVRAQLAERLAVSGNAPKPLIYALARDEIIVAAPVIAKSPLLDEPELIAIVRDRTRAHRLLVAARPGIPAAVSDALLAAREPEVLETLVNNPTAEIAAAALEYVIEQSRMREALHGALISRADLPPHLLQKMLGFVSSELKQHYLGKLETDQEAFDTALRQIGKPQASPAPGMNAKAATLIERLQANGELNVARVIAFLRERHLQLFYAGMAALARCEVQNLTHFVVESEDKGLAVICRAVGADRGQFVSAVLLQRQARGGDPLPAGHLHGICRLFDSLTEAHALAVLEHWRVRTGDGQRAMNAA